MELPIREALFRRLDNGRIRDLTETEGLTIERIVKTHWRYILVFNDGRFAYVPQAEGSVHYQPELLAEAGIITAADLEQINQEMATINAERAEAYQRKLYGELKAKFEGGSDDPA